MENQQLVKDARAGDTRAFAQLYETIYKDLYRFAVYTLKNAHDAEDAVSETILAAYHKITSLRQAGSFKSWMFQILSNQCRKKWKDQERLRPENDMLQFEEIDPRDLSGDLSLQEAFYHLNEEERMIIALSVFGGCNSSEIGEHLGINAATVRSKLRRALTKLKLFLGEKGEARDDR